MDDITLVQYSTPKNTGKSGSVQLIVRSPGHPLSSLEVVVNVSGQGSEVKYQGDSLSEGTDSFNYWVEWVHKLNQESTFIMVTNGS